MSLFSSCEHEWETAAKAVGKPVTISEDDFFFLDQDEREKYMLGYTTVLRVCKKPGCGAQRVVEMLGVLV